MTTAFVYKWTHIPTMKYYVGSRTRKGCHPNDGYICSSREVKPMIEENPTQWIRTIVAVGSPEEMYSLETDILQTMDCKNDPRSFNKHNNDSRIAYPGLPKSMEHRAKLSKVKTGKKIGPCTEERKQKISKANKGRTNMTEAQRDAIIKANKLSKRHIIPHTEESIAKMKISIAKRPEYICPHCGKTSRSGVIKRWHFDNCKNK